MIIKDSQINLFKENHQTSERVYLDEVELVENELRNKSSKELIDFDSDYDWSDLKDRKYIIATIFYSLGFFAAMFIFLSIIYVLGV